MINIISGNIFESNAQTITNPVNCVGVMGKGLAKQFKVRFPEMFKDYVFQCQKKRLQLGKPYIFKSYSHPWILLFPTKYHWRSQSNLDDIVQGLEYLGQHILDWQIESLALPALGCGLGELDWKIVKPVILKILADFDIPIELYEKNNYNNTERM